MGGRRPSGGYHRREEEARERRRQWRITLAVAGVLSVVAVLLVAGLVINVVLPPRSTALVVGVRSYTTAELANRSVAAVRLGAGAATMNELIDRVVDSLIREELLHQRGEPIVGEPDEEALRDEVRRSLELDDTVDDEMFAAVYQQFLQESQVSRAEFEWIVRAAITAERLRDHFGGEIDDAGPQVLVYVAQSRDPEMLAELRARVMAGEDFAEVVVDLELAEDAEELNRGWRPEETLSADQQAALEGLDGGDISEVITPPGSLDAVLYYVAQREAEREYDDAMRAELEARRLNEFLEEQRAIVGVRVELSDTERNWVARRIRDGLS